MHPKRDAGFRLAIVNPLTLVGNEIKTILRERSVPFDKVVLLDSTGEAAGALTDVGDEPAVVAAISELELADCDVVFFCGPAAANHDWVERARSEKYTAIDLSQPSAIEDASLAVAGVNLDDAAGPVLVSPHPIAIPIALILHQIEQISQIELCTASIVQPASAFDQAGVDELIAQTLSVLNVKSVPQKVFDRQLAFNLYPAPEHSEAFITAQLRQLIDPETQIALFVTQGTIYHGHTFSLFIKTRNPVDISRITQALQANKALAFAEGDQAFGTIDAAGRDEVLIAEVREEPSVKGGFWVWAVCDNLRRSSALNAVLIAEKVLYGEDVN